MIIRIVRMTFRPDAVVEFVKIFNESQAKIRATEGCQHLELLQDAHSPNVYSTYSIWASEKDLNNYRNSDLFGNVWPKTKSLFQEKPVAQSYFQKIKLD